MSHAHAVVWLDHTQAKVIHFSAEESVTQHVKQHGTSFYHEIAKALNGVREILVLGPGLAKQEFVKHLESHDPSIAKAVLGVEASDHPSEGQVLDHARRFFKAKDRMIAH